MRKMHETLKRFMSIKDTKFSYSYLLSYSLTKPTCADGCIKSVTGKHYWLIWFLTAATDFKCSSFP